MRVLVKIEVSSKGISLKVWTLSIASRYKYPIRSCICNCKIVRRDHGDWELRTYSMLKAVFKEELLFYKTRDYNAICWFSFFLLL